jgi:PAS domain S-box-containing protein
MRIQTRLRLNAWIVLGSSLCALFVLAWSYGAMGDAGQNRTLVILQLCIVGIVTVTVVTFVLLSRMLSRRLADLRAGAEIIGNGCLDYRIEVGGGDELDDLAQLTNRMAANLQQSFTSVAYLESEIASRNEAERALLASQSSLRQAEWRTSVINRIANVFLTAPDDKLYGEVLEIVLDTMGSRFGIFGFIGDNGDLVIPSLTRTAWQECRVPDKSIVFPPDTWRESIWGQAIRERRSICSTGPFHIPEGHVPIDNFLTVPIVFAERTIGLLSVANKERGYDGGNISLLESIAAYVSPVLNAQLQRNRQEREREKAEEELRQLSLAVEQSPVSILITDTGGTIQYVNPRFSQLTGYAMDEVKGRNPRFLKSGETPTETYRSLWGTITSGNVWQGEFRNRKKNGELFLEFATIAPVKDPQGTITSYIAIKEDVTERRSLENQLRQSQKMEAIGTLAGGVAHDFNNILTAIIGFGSLLEMKMPPDNPLHHNVAQILAAADRAANLTRSLLAFSRTQQMETKVLDLNDTVTGLEKMLHRLIREDIELTICTVTTPLTVRMDAGQIEQVLINLVANARDAMPNGGTLSVTTAMTILDEEFRTVHGYGEPGDYALLAVADNGEGMAEEIRQRVFDPFFTTKEVGKGTGLGLSVCYGIVKQHGGYINCYSEPGRGTVFRIYLPLSRGEAEFAEPGRAVFPAGGTETILLAEDDPVVRNLTTTLLTEFGYTVIQAADGDEAIARFREAGEKIALCIFDVIMPRMKGWEAFDGIRAIGPTVPVLFMSGYQADFDRLADLTKNGAGFLSKPVVPRDLLAKVREMLEGSWQGKASRSG